MNLRFLPLWRVEQGGNTIPQYQNVEIGGGRITGTEITPEHPEGIAFGMYHADQYVAPEGQYTTVHSADGAAWYKQYAVDSVDKSPYMAPDGSIAYFKSCITATTTLIWSSPFFHSISEIPASFWRSCGKSGEGGNAEWSTP